MDFQLLRSTVLGHLPNPLNLLPGQPAVNLNKSQPGLYFSDSEGDALIKIGPASVVSEPPVNPTVGECWVQPDGSEPGVPMLWMFDGTDWRGVPLTETYEP